MRNLITDIDGISVGHAHDLDLASGVTAIIFDRPAVASGLALGGAPGSRDQLLLDPARTVETVDAFVLSGGSAFGLDAAGGVQSGLRADGRGLAIGPALIPIESRRRSRQSSVWIAAMPFPAPPRPAWEFLRSCRRWSTRFHRLMMRCRSRPRP